MDRANRDRGSSPTRGRAFPAFRVRRTAVLALTVALLGCSDPLPEAQWVTDLAPPSQTSRRLSVSGSTLCDALDREVVLRGFNAGGRAKMPPYLPFDVVGPTTVAAAADDFFGRLGALGANTVRLVFSWEAFEPTAGVYDDAYLAQYVELLDAAFAHGTFVVVDFHQDVFSSAFCGDGFPSWALGDVPHGDPHYDCSFPGWSLPAFDPTSPVSQAFDRLWANADGLQDDMEAMWRRVAASLGSHPAVAAFEILNEPAPGSTAAATFDAVVLPAFYERMGAAIREEAGDFPIFFDERIGAMANPDTLVPPDLPGAVYAPHYYEPSIAIGGEEVNEETIAVALEGAFEVTEAWDVPVFLGEFGVPNGNAAKSAYLDFLLDRVDLHRGHATLWDASMSDTFWNGEDFTVLRADGTEQPWAGAIVRPYPRAISGRIVAFAWDADAARFELEVDDAGGEISEIYLPRRHLGDSPTLEVRGDVRAMYDASLELLLVDASPGARFTVSATP